MKTATFLIFPFAIWALPQSPDVIAGTLDCRVQSPEVLEIVVSDQAIIEWREFSIGANETTRFYQPNESSIVLNHVLSDVPSQLMGRLESNGQVILVNTSGILVGKEAQIHTGSFIASSLDVNREVFLSSGILQFSGNGEGIIKNEGMIASKNESFLIGPLVENQGSITSQKAAGMMAVHAVEWGSQKVYVKTAWAEEENPFAGAFVSPTYLRNSGTISVEGGSIWLLGDYLHIQNSSEILADGENGGGQIWIGGDFQGQNGSMKNAAMSYIEPGALISASALQQGDGGRVILWADEETSFYGSVLAKGATGKGGFAEISGAKSLVFQGTFDGSSFSGLPGELLLDPNNITISTGATTNGPFPVGGTCFDGTTPIGTCHPASVGTQPAVLNTAELTASLAAGNSVTVQTNPLAVGGNGDITLANAVTIPNGSGSLTLNASRNINLNAALTSNNATTTTDITLTAAGAITTAAAGTITFGAGTTGQLNLTGATITTNGAITSQSTGAITLTSAGIAAIHANIQSTTGAVSVIACGNITIQPITTFVPVAVGSQNALTTVRTTGDLSILGGIGMFQASAQIGYFPPSGANSSGSIDVECRNLFLTAGTPANHNSAIIGHGQFNLSNNIAPTNFAFTTTGANITVNASGNIALNSTVNPPAFRAEALIGHGCNAPNPTVGSCNQDGNISVTSGGNITLFSSGGGCFAGIGHLMGIDIGGVGGTITTLSGNISVMTNGNLSFSSGNLSNSDPVFIGHTSFGFKTQNLTGNITVCTGGNLSMVPGNSPGPYTIGHYTAVAPPAPIVTGIYEISVGGNLIMTAPVWPAAAPNAFYIGGMLCSGTNGTDPIQNVRMSMVVQGNATLTSQILIQASNASNFGIGFKTATPSTSSLNLIVGGNLTVNGPQNTTIGCRGDLAPLGQGDCNIAVGGNFDFISTNTNNDRSCVGAYTGGVTRIFAGGRVFGTSPDIVAQQLRFGFLSTRTAGTFSNAVDIRAGTDIQIPNAITTTGVAPNSYIRFLAAHAFTSGELWNLTAQTICGGQTITPNLNLTCSGTSTQGCATAPINFNITSPITLISNSVNPTPPARCFPDPTVAGNPAWPPSTNTSGCGAFFVQQGLAVIAYPFAYNPGSSDFMISSSCTACTAGLPNNCGGGPATQTCLSIGAAATNQIRIAGTPSNIYIGEFYNLNINQVLNITGVIDLKSCNAINLSGATTSSGAAGAINLRSGNILNINQALTAVGNISALAVNALTTSAPITASGATSSISLTSLTANLNLAGNVTASGGPLLLSAGMTLDAACLPTCGTPGTGSIVQTAGIISTIGTGTISGFASQDITLNGTGPSVSGVGGAVSFCANNNFTVDKAVTATTGPITLIADVDNTGVGDLSVNAAVTTTTGAICLEAGPGTFGCSQNNCRSGLISGFPVGNCTVTISAPVSSTSGSITVTSSEDILVNNTLLTSGPIALTAGLGDLTINNQINSGSTIFTFAGNNTILTQGAGPTLILAGGEIRMITGLNMTFNPNTAVRSTGAQVTIVVDNIHPIQTPVPPPSSISGSLTMLAGSSLTSGSPLRIFTAYSQTFGVGPGLNFIDPSVLLNNQSPAAFGYPGTPFADTATEQWCTFFGCPANYPFPNLGVPFTIFYKICEQILVQQAQIIVTEFLVDLHPYDEYPGWMEQFWVKYEKTPNLITPSSLDALRNEPYYLRRRHLNNLNQPKSWTAIIY